MSKVKEVNYTDEMVAVLKEGYTGEDNATEVATLAEATGKSPASVRAKLSSMGVYVKEAKATKAKSATKRVIAEAIAKEAGLAEFEVDGLEKATKGALTKVFNALVNS
jgi:hypothetical protein